MLSFHGMWSLAGFTGALVGLGMLVLNLTTYTHFIIVACIVLGLVAFNYKLLIRAKETQKTEYKNLFQTRPHLNLARRYWLLLYG